MDMRNTVEIKCSGFHDELVVKVTVGVESEMRRKAGGVSREREAGRSGGRKEILKFQAWVDGDNFM